MTQANYPPASILDITSYGFRAALRHIGSMTLILLPLLIPLALGYGFSYATILQASKGDFTNPMGFVIGIFMQFGCILLSYYLYYVILRYVRDVFFEAVQPNLFSYLLPKFSLLGVLGLALLLMIAWIPAGIVMLIGFILVIVPGIIAVLYFSVWSSMIFVTYLAHPEKGISSALVEVYQLLKGSFWRSIGLVMLVGLINMIISSPVGIINYISQILVETNPSFLESIWFALAYTTLYGVGAWFHATVGVSGGFFVMYRFYFDLRNRRDGFKPVRAVPGNFIQS